MDPSNLTEAHGVIIAAILAAGGAIAGMLITKDIKITEFRHEWLKDIRNDIVIFITKATYIANQNNTREKCAYNQKIIDLHQLKNSIVIKIKNDSSNDFSKFIERRLLLICDLIGKNNLTQNDINLLLESSSKFQKQEWERIKKGEKFYDYSKKSIIFILIISITLSLGISFCDKKADTNNRSYTITIKNY